MCAGGCSESLTGWGWRESCAKCDGAWCGHTWTRARLHALRGLGVSMARERLRGQMQARQRDHDRACKVRTRLGCAGVSCVSWLAVDHHGHLIGSCWLTTDVVWVALARQATAYLEGSGPPVALGAPVWDCLSEACYRVEAGVCRIRALPPVRS